MPASFENSHLAAKKGAVCTRTCLAGECFSVLNAHHVVMTLRRRRENIIQSICMPSAEIPPQQRCNLGGHFPSAERFQFWWRKLLQICAIYNSRPCHQLLSDVSGLLELGGTATKMDWPNTSFIRHKMSVHRSRPVNWPTLTQVTENWRLHYKGNFDLDRTLLLHGQVRNKTVEFSRNRARSPGIIIVS